MTSKEKDVVLALTDKGYVVVIFNPEELKGSDSLHISELLTQKGFELIDLNGGD